MSKEINFAELARQVTQALGRDESRKQRVLAQLPNIGFALDAGELAQMSAHGVAVQALKSLGLKAPTNGDAVELLDAYLFGRRQGAQLRAGVKLSAMDRAPDFLDKYLKG